MQERDIYCLSFLTSYPQDHCSQSVSHSLQPCWVVPACCWVVPACCCPGPHHLWEQWSLEWCHHFHMHLSASSDQHGKHLLLVCSLVPSPSSNVHTDVFFCRNKQNITLLFVFLTYKSFKWVSLSLYSGNEVCEVWGKKRLKGQGDRGVRGTSTGKAGFGFSVGCMVGFHSPARIGSFCQKHLGPKEKSCDGWIHKARAVFYAKKWDDGVSAAKGYSAKFFFCIVSKAASPAAHRGETNTRKQQQKVHLNWPLKNSETAWKSKAQTG